MLTNASVSKGRRYVERADARYSYEARNTGTSPAKSKEGSTGNGIDRSKASNVSCTVDGKVLLYRDHDAANRDHGT